MLACQPQEVIWHYAFEMNPQFEHHPYSDFDSRDFDDPVPYHWLWDLGPVVEFGLVEHWDL